jgi:glutamine cyclotransferase
MASKGTFVIFFSTLFLTIGISPLVFGQSPLLNTSGAASPLYGKQYLAANKTTVTPIYGYRVINVYPHDPDAFTQGLTFYQGDIYEGTGLYGNSSLRKIELATGKILKVHHLPAKYFGEGITIWRNKLIQLTWKSKIGFVYDLQTFRLLRTFSYPSEGWGITCDGNNLIMSDGTATLRFLNPRTFKVVRQIEVRDHGKAVPHINELEYVRGEVYANIWDTGYIARVSPQTGKILGWIDLRGLDQLVPKGGKADVLNGIAYDEKNDRLFVTGKFWPHIFEIQLKILQ